VSFPICSLVDTLTEPRTTSECSCDVQFSSRPELTSLHPSPRRVPPSPSHPLSLPSSLPSSPANSNPPASLKSSPTLPTQPHPGKPFVFTLRTPSLLVLLLLPNFHPPLLWRNDKRRRLPPSLQVPRLSEGRTLPFPRWIPTSLLLRKEERMNVSPFQLSIPFPLFLSLLPLELASSPFVSCCAYYQSPHADLFVFSYSPIEPRSNPARRHIEPSPSNRFRRRVRRRRRSLCSQEHPSIRRRPRRRSRGIRLYPRSTQEEEGT